MPNRNLDSTRWRCCVAAACLSVGAFAGCKTERSSPTLPVESSSSDVSVATPEGDPSVPADQGGPGFTGEGWEPAGEYPLEGSPDAVKGGAIRYFVGSFPATVRFVGKDSNTTTTGICSFLMIPTPCYSFFSSFTILLGIGSVRSVLARGRTLNIAPSMVLDTSSAVSASPGDHAGKLP